MNGIEKIIAHLEADARGELDELNAETQRTCDEILAGAREEAEKAYAARMASGRNEAAQHAERLASAAALEEKKAILACKQQLVQETFTAAEAALAALPEKENIAFLARLAADAAQSGDEELIFNAHDAALARKVCAEANRLLRVRGLHGGLTPGAETRDISGGVIVCQGNIETNCSIAALLESQRSALATQVAEILFAE